MLSDVTLAQLVDNFNVATSYYGPVQKRMVVLNAVDNSKLWQAIGAKFPKYQILPDTNIVSYIKANLLASIYTVAKSASVLPTSDEDRELVEHLNVALDYIWDMNDIGYYQMQAGSAAALFNVGITQVGWDADAKEVGVGGKTVSGNAVVKNIHPLKFMRDPFAESLDTASYCMTWDDYHKSVIEADPKYRDKFQEYLASEAVATAMANPMEAINNRAEAAAGKDYYKVVIHFMRYTDDDGKPCIAEVHTLNNEHILYQKDKILPNCFPFVELFCNLPEGDIVGTSEPAKILSNNIAYNILNSMMLTAEYKNQRPPKFINSQSGLNLQTFTKYGNDADHTFVVSGDASRAVHYHQFPYPSSMAPSIQANLLRDVQMTSGVDGRYTGRDTGSVITTGGVEDMLNRVTLIDTPKIVNYERYCKQLTKLILANFIEFSMKRTYFKKNPLNGAFESYEVDYSKLSDPAFYHYSINISSELPKNKQRVASMANMLMEKQMQYGANGSNGPELLTPEEWLQFQDLPNKEYMLKRMNIQRLSDTTSEVAETLFSFSNLVKNGTAPDEAIAAGAENLMAQRRGENPPVEIPPMEADPYAAEMEALANMQPMTPQPGAELDPALLQTMQMDPSVMDMEAPIDESLLGGTY